VSWKPQIIVIFFGLSNYEDVKYSLPMTLAIAVIIQSNCGKVTTEILMNSES
jgi:hypothetical protein